MRSSTSPHASFEPSRLPSLLAGLAAGPLAWAALLQTNYVLSYVACEQRHTWMLHLATAIALALVAAGAALAWHAAPRLGPDEHRGEEPQTTAVLRARFMALAALTLCAWFAIVIIATEIPAVLMHPCTP